ncbi:MAG TPA: polysaccharide biosynthesis protein [Vicinamibacterales bacterium]
MIELDRTTQERLLGRRVETVLTTADTDAFARQRILVTGAGGSVGGELVRQLAGCQPAHLALLDHAEYGLFRVEAEVRDLFPRVPITLCLADVSRRVDMQRAVRDARPTVVFHAAAYKHVTLAEQAVVAAARTNVLGTIEVVRAAKACGARFVFISTDKAAEPRSVMGATKRFAELVVLDQASEAFRPIVTRFGNILGSSGSVVEIMLRRAARGLPVPVTDPQATRFFMTGEEAAALVMKADRIGRGGEVFWLDMGDAIRIGELADRVIALGTPVGRRPAPVETIGLRPGEKMSETLTAQGLEMRRTSFQRIWAARQRDVARLDVYRALRLLRRACAMGNDAAVIEALTTAVADYEPSHAVRGARSLASPAAIGYLRGALPRI